MQALIIVDVQYDFLPGGALAVRDGDKVIPVINSIQPKFDLIVATQDWHPADHGSFAANHPGTHPGEVIKLSGVDQVLWPVHCVQGSEGAGFHRDLDQSRWTKVFQKGTNRMVDSYSGFYDNNRMGDTGLAGFLKQERVNEVFVVGLATDYCVKFTVIDALLEGFDTWVVVDATKGVNLSEQDSLLAIDEMIQAGAQVIESRSVSQ
ncbi:MAG: bifunctional nicotinamidase/pyrazinamidase [Lunatimonas sp.]|uniref:bifunctional nicotinamidase/pyrazinamidase n=1 Tax=Lunatimonas sp. TaxID=2060141 RepID=UPI00263B57E1|nr:bifunctional nicotinamidase/pyrazinamidase [Lunatimonas sp.]MCC5936632.1 bifunctional nicotinamidase/pyrazinamidase [Lunatimonas sp.]